MAGVGTQKVFEDDRVVVWHLDLEPGEHGETHSHDLDFVVHVVSGSELEVSGPDGQLLYAVNRQPGAAAVFRVDGDQLVSDEPDSAPIPATHSVRNVGTSTFREVLIEFKNQ